MNQSNKIKYFAYGSNMCSGRLRDRICCEFDAIASLPGYQLRFHKVSKDKSSKCDAFYTGADGDEVWGVIFDIPAADKSKLDAYEGLGSGYKDASVVVQTSDGKQLQVRTYVADPKSIKTGLAPYTWYKAFVETGAQEHNLPEAYVAGAIQAIEAVQDSDRGRHERETCRLQPWKKRQESVSTLRLRSFQRRTAGALGRTTFLSKLRNRRAYSHF